MPTDGRLSTRPSSRLFYGYSDNGQNGYAPSEHSGEVRSLARRGDNNLIALGLGVFADSAALSGVLWADITNTSASMPNLIRRVIALPYCLPIAFASHNTQRYFSHKPSEKQKSRNTRHYSITCSRCSCCIRLRMPHKRNCHRSSLPHISDGGT